MADRNPPDTYLRVLVRHWKGALVTWLSFAGLVAGTSVKDVVRWPSWSWWLVGVSGLTFAQWRAWKDERERGDMLQDMADITTHTVEQKRRRESTAHVSIRGGSNAIIAANDGLVAATNVGFELLPSPGVILPRLDSTALPCNLEPHSQRQFHVLAFAETTTLFDVVLYWTDGNGNHRSGPIQVDVS